MGAGGTQDLVDRANLDIGMVASELGQLAEHGWRDEYL